jgi:hypothetical protein
MIHRDSLSAAARWGASLMTWVDAVSEAGSSPWRLAESGRTADYGPRKLAIWGIPVLGQPVSPPPHPSKEVRILPRGRLHTRNQSSLRGPCSMNRSTPPMTTFLAPVPRRDRKGRHPVRSNPSLYRDLRKFGEGARRVTSVLLLVTSTALLSDQKVCAQPPLVPQPREVELKSEIELGVELVKFRISLNDFVQIMRRISGSAQSQALKSELKQVIVEVRKSYATVVDAFTPFVALDNQAKFDQEFGAKYAAFINKYLTQTNVVRTHSTIVTNKLQQLALNSEWRSLFPILQRQYWRLARLSRDWAASDVALSTALDRLLINLHEFLQSIAFLKHQDPTAAFEEFQEDLELFKDDFLSVKEKLDELDVISAGL